MGERQVASDRAVGAELSEIYVDLVERMPIGVVVWQLDKDMQTMLLVRCNSMAARLVGADLVEAGRPMRELFPETTKERESLYAEAAETGQAKDLGETTYRGVDGSQRTASSRLVPLRGRRVAVVFEDISEQKRAIGELQRNEERFRSLEEQLGQAQKLEAIGKLAGGVAHDFNNLLSVILGTSVLALERNDLDEPLRADIREIKRAGERAADLTRQLLAFSRQQILAPTVLDLNETISNIDRMLRRIIGEDIELRTRLTPDLATIRVDPGQIEQVIMNLVVNARDAMPNGGVLAIETRNVSLDQAYAVAHPSVSPGSHVMLAISDTGVGISKDIQDRIFDPFFTTKGVGKGTGLGLSTVFGIVKQSEGSISFQSEPNKGTTFKIYFPCTNGEAAPSRPRSVAPQSRGSETILLVEDDVQVQAIVSDILRSRGYRVIDAADTEAALRICRVHSGPIDLLLTDVIMPRMSGRELAEHVSAIRPTIKVLYMSGYADTIIDHHGVLEDDIAFLQKPITPIALAQKVREVLDAEQPLIR